MARPLNQVADTVEKVVADKPATFSWRELASDEPLTEADKRTLLLMRPVLDFKALEPGGAAVDAIRKAAADANLAKDYGARVRLTGPVPIANDEFSTVQEGALVTHTGTVLIVLFILWCALKSSKIIGAVFVTLLIGLSVTTAVGLMLVGAFNLISIAFFVLFVGLGVDFGIQYSVRYRAERHEIDSLDPALEKAAEYSAVPLTLAAVATAAGFLSFLPTDYKGVSELGKIAGAGMIVAFIAAITVLPALLKILNPPGEAEPLGFQFLAPVDRFLERHRVGVVVATLGVAVLGLPLLYFLQFDFNPMNLRSAKVESVATYLDLRRDPNTGTNAVEVMVPSTAPRRKKSRKAFRSCPRSPEPFRSIRSSRTISRPSWPSSGRRRRSSIRSSTRGSGGPRRRMKKISRL
jgi:hopanoid biosynthesis associated RND transporter like protein HpnN